MNAVDCLLLASQIAGVALVIAFTLLLATFLIWSCNNYLAIQIKRLKIALEVQDVHEFGKEYREWKAEREKK